MKKTVRVLGGGFYGCHLSLALLDAGYDVELHEIAGHLFAGASGGNPARCHRGFHYPRSQKTRHACQEHHAEFLGRYGFLTRPVPCNIYAIAADDSLVDFGTYVQVLRNEVEFITIDRPEEYGLRHVEGAVLTGERHVLLDEARKYFEKKLSGCVVYNMPPGKVDDLRWHATIDCTFCAFDETNIDRYEPCLTALLEGPTDRAVTIMDGPFCSLFPWNEERGLSSLTSASLTPFSKTCRTWAEARALLDGLNTVDIVMRSTDLLDQMAFYWPGVRDRYRVVDHKLTIRAMPRSGADARLVDVIRVGERALRIRAGKIDAIFQAERTVKEVLAA